MKYFGHSVLRTLVVGLLALWGVALAQHPLAGTYLEPTIGFIVSFQTGSNGQLGGVLIGKDGPIPLQMQVDIQTAQGVFTIEGVQYGFQAQLAPDGTNLAFNLYMLDPQGTPIQATVERYTAMRQQMMPPQSPMSQTPPMSPMPPVQQPTNPLVPTNPGATPPPPTSQPLPANPLAQPTPPTPPMQQPMNPPTPPTSGSTPTQANPLVGTWQGDWQPAPNVTIRLVDVFRPDGTYREEGYIAGKMIAFFEGTYTLSPDGTLQQTETNVSPQICINGECRPNDPPTSSTMQVAFQGPNTISVTKPGEGGQPPLTVTFQRLP